MKRISLTVFSDLNRSSYLKIKKQKKQYLDFQKTVKYQKNLLVCEFIWRDDYVEESYLNERKLIQRIWL